MPSTPIDASCRIFWILVPCSSWSYNAEKYLGACWGTNLVKSSITGSCPLYWMLRQKVATQFINPKLTQGWMDEISAWLDLSEILTSPVLGYHPTRGKLLRADNDESFYLCHVLAWRPNACRSGCLPVRWRGIWNPMAIRVIMGSPLLPPTPPITHHSAHIKSF